jgi:hypothetical protein
VVVEHTGQIDRIPKFTHIERGASLRYLDNLDALRRSTGSDHEQEAAIMGGSDRRRQRRRLAVASFILSLLISAHRGEHVDGQEAAGRLAAEIVAAEFFGTFRQVVRFVFLVATVE